jgi:hypothetical protein
MFKALYRFFTPVRRFVISAFPGQWWKDLCCHFGIHQDVISEPSDQAPRKFDFFCPNRRCGAILWQDKADSAVEGPEKENEYTWTSEAS